jgi:hypothetical protein
MAAVPPRRRKPAGSWGWEKHSELCGEGGAGAGLRGLVAGPSGAAPCRPLPRARRRARSDAAGGAPSQGHAVGTARAGRYRRRAERRDPCRRPVPTVPRPAPRDRWHGGTTPAWPRILRWRRGGGGTLRQSIRPPEAGCPEFRLPGRRDPSRGGEPIPAAGLRAVPGAADRRPASRPRSMGDGSAGAPRSSKVGRAPSGPRACGPRRIGGAHATVVGSRSSGWRPRRSIDGPFTSSAKMTQRRFSHGQGRAMRAGADSSVLSSACRLAVPPLDSGSVSSRAGCAPVRSSKDDRRRRRPGGTVPAARGSHRARGETPGRAEGLTGIALFSQGLAENRTSPIPTGARLAGRSHGARRGRSGGRRDGESAGFLEPEESRSPARRGEASAPAIGGFTPNRRYVNRSLTFGASGRGISVNFEVLLRATVLTGASRLA